MQRMNTVDLWIYIDIYWWQLTKIMPFSNQICIHSHHIILLKVFFSHVICKHSISNTLLMISMHSNQLMFGNIQSQFKDHKHTFNKI